MAAAMGSKVMEVLARRRESLVSVLLLGSFVALSVRSDQQERQIEALEAEKSALRAANTAMSTAMWSWRQHLYQLAADHSSSFSAVIPAARLHAIYGEADPAETAAAANLQTGVGEDAAEEDSIMIA